VSNGEGDPLHGITLKMMVIELHAELGWDGLAARIDIKCFTENPSIKSSLTFLRRTPWAREKVEYLYLRTKLRGKGASSRSSAYANARNTSNKSTKNDVRGTKKLGSVWAKFGESQSNKSEAYNSGNSNSGNSKSGPYKSNADDSKPKKPKAEQAAATGENPWLAGKFAPKD